MHENSDIGSSSDRKKICLISTIGGHLSQLVQLKKLYKDYEHYFVTSKGKFPAQILRNEKVYYVEHTMRSPTNLFSNFIKSLQILMREKPDVIITTGAGDALPTCYLGRLLGIKVVFIESFSRVAEQSLFGFFAHPISDLTLVQRRSLLSIYRGSMYGGPVFQFDDLSEYSIPERPKAFITVGTQRISFNRLLTEIDGLIDNGIISDESIAQIGHSSYKIKNCRSFRFAETKEILRIMKGCDLVIAHGGVGSISDALSLGKVTIAVPRIKELGEVVDDNQINLTKELEKDGLIILAENEKKLGEAITTCRDFRFDAKGVGKSNVIGLIKDYLDGLSDIPSK